MKKTIKATKGSSEAACSAWWLAGWTRKRDQYCACHSDPLELCTVHGRQESALMRHAWTKFVDGVHKLPWVMKQNAAAQAQRKL